MGLSEGGVFVKKKDQDFSVARKHHMRITRPDVQGDIFEHEFFVSFFATEIKTNLDKTMFQEAAATAGELKRASSGSKYILLCEWLDMTPINTKLTAMDEVIVLRRCKRLASNVRKDFASVAGREKAREWYEKFLDDNPLSLEGFKRLVFHLNECFPAEEHDSAELILERGYF
jgi:hypothetical protein